MNLVSFCISWVLAKLLCFTEEVVFPFWVNGCTTRPEPSPQWVPSQQVHVFHHQGGSETRACVGKVRSKSQGSHNRVCCVYGDHDGIFWSHLQDSHLWGLRCWRLTVGVVRTGWWLHPLSGSCQQNLPTGEQEELRRQHLMGCQVGFFLKTTARYGQSLHCAWTIKSLLTQENSTKPEEERTELRELNFRIFLHFQSKLLVNKAVIIFFTY